MERSKESTARISLYTLIKAPEIFTLETSQFGIVDKFLSGDVFQDIAVTLCKGIAKMYKVGRNPGKIFENQNSLSLNLRVSSKGNEKEEEEL